MWYRAIPAAVITVVTGYTIPFYVSYIFNKLDVKRPYRRHRYHFWTTYLLRRDEYLSGNIFVTKGLENIPDAP
ncbi:hypothetical protein T02_12170 [Trichinella nativa]|uniref:Uncharacterized protein n=4 Tax=Trichinella TaxID=6333 RepID=A0A0V1LSJ3_9BILA|nr:hypothetical protein T05_6853 [Trichinella murrelli]KRX55244.1 hypothetical protein T09_12809 [Trichinella sp. T9]KRX72764.1 hypothetical protein T06_9018 [Trichinella sp. T6]KRY14376.1 hypothetical protein T12_4686 [Trichinella patagoniensis]KRY60259.1 hypothetical protein T03_17956 [Trichinella britovi]KRZ62485.1 hypothetical protein T02_12170 [Trichinella nativa]KRZ95384.1 hypothetical protein T08_13733 [Trichinella sp. T8]